MFTKDRLNAEELHQVVINHLTDGIFLVDREQNILVWNDAAAGITGYSREELLGQPFGVLEQIDRAGTPIPSSCSPVAAAFQDGKEYVNEQFFRHKRGYMVPVLMKLTPLCLHGEQNAVMGVFTDTSLPVKQNDLVSSLSKLIINDQLTGLSNQRHVERILETRLEELRRKGTKSCVLYISLDQYAEYNTKYGYDAGNRVLIALADQFRKATRETDLIGRWNGEEFVGAFEIKSMEHLKLVAEKMRVLIEQTRLDEMNTRMTASIGATMILHGDTPKELVERAASLMHVSRISGKNCVTVG